MEYLVRTWGKGKLTEFPCQRTQQNVWDSREVRAVTRHFLCHGVSNVTNVLRLGIIWSGTGVVTCLFPCSRRIWGGSESLHFNEFPGDGDTAGPGIKLWKAWLSLRTPKSKSSSQAPAPVVVPCLCSAPVACVVRIAGILITQLQPSARIPGDPGKHTLLQGHGQVTESRLPKARVDVFLLSPPPPSFACPKPWTNLGAA